MVRSLLLAAMVLLLLHPLLLAQEVRVTATVDRAAVSIGDWITLHLEVTAPPGVSVAWPNFSDALKDFEIVRRGNPTSAAKGQSSTSSLDLVLTRFEEGPCTIPPLSIGYTAAKDSTPGTATTAPITISVKGIQVDTSKDIKDIKPPLRPRISFREILRYLLAAAGAALLAWLAYYIISRRKRGVELLPQAPPRPPHEIALEALRLLDAEKLWQQGHDKEYHARLSDILRTYIEHTLRIPAMEWTTSLIVSSERIRALDPSLKNRLREVLERSDLVKFAKFRPVAEENTNSMDTAVWFVQHAQQADTTAKGAA